MSICGYCGGESDDSLPTCRECGTELSPAIPPAPPAGLPRRFRRSLVIVGLVVLVVSGVVMPHLLWAIPVLAIIYLPIYGPFLASFAFTSRRWRGLRWSLRAATLLALVIWLHGTSQRPDFGDDVAGNIAGFSYNVAWVWSAGFACLFAALIVGLALRAFQKGRPGVAPAIGPTAHSDDSKNQASRFGQTV